MKAPNYWKVKPIKMHFNLDSDRDGVPDHKDCRPFNPHKQHIRPSRTMQQRLSKLPIFFTSSEASQYDIEVGKKFYTVHDKDVPASIEKVRQRFYSMIKKRPEVIGEIERKKPSAVLFTTRGLEIYDEAGYTHEVEAGRPTITVRLSSLGRGHPYRSEEIEESAGTTIHELEHVRQAKAWSGKPKLKKRMKKGSHEKRKEEILAYGAEEKAFKKRYDYSNIPFEFNPRYEAIKEENPIWFKRESPKLKRKQERFFEGYREMINEE